ncbi:PAS domain S-box-containing protein/diguanylate cyclase (GGDEF) domain-containing protein [Amphibacillus marinus]|uniref:PAS domain S-box-containing protein/diguanylate cyclase (GGDEF) domain-containing protein n=1 Tax=Amphibacillus marinus TaxID=872970 RepID=A0A1H8R0E4_9BACI|nr:diguanylate cyclase [Amphibacillus marinus]SEO59806.1 PAS domain S-box-containing protein/diguanylate cyclase (GGDEF) domain-containing protein [Amphibacillus marinus]
MDLTTQTILDNIQDMVFVMQVGKHDQFVYQFINQAAREKLNITNAVIGKTIHDVNPPTQAVIITEQYRNVLRSKAICIYEDNYFISSDGNKVSETTLSPIIESGRVTHIIAVTKDITAMKQAQEQESKSQQRLRMSRQRYKSLFDENTDAIAYLNLTGKIIRMNKACRQLMKLMANQDNRGNVFEAIVTEDKDCLAESFRQTTNGNARTIDIKVNGVDHFQIILQVKMIPMVHECQVQGVYMMLKDRTTEYFAKEMIVASEERFRLIAEHSSDLIQLLDQDGNYVYLSPSHQPVLGYQTSELQKMTLLELCDPAYSEMLEQRLAQLSSLKETQKLEVRLMNKAMHYQWFELHLEPVFASDGTYKHTIVVARDIEERKEHEEELHRLAYHDPLTGLANRRLFNARLEQVLALYVRQQNPFAVAMLDLDDFKAINDSNGHDVGDDVIIELARRLALSVREMDTVARLGGDEFILLLPEIGNRDDLMRVLNRIEDALLKPYQINNQTYLVGASIGAVMSTNYAITTHSIIRAADQALYAAKRTGKNKVVIHDQRMPEESLGKD